MEELLSAMGYSESDEERFLKALGQGLLEEFRILRAEGAHPRRFSRV